MSDMPKIGCVNHDCDKCSQLEKAARQALEALEHANKDDFWREQHEAITALRRALEQPAERPEPPHCMVGGLIKDNAMCGHVIQMKFCGYGGPCQYKGDQK